MSQLRLSLLLTLHRACLIDSDDGSTMKRRMIQTNKKHKSVPLRFIPGRFIAIFSVFKASCRLFCCLWIFALMI